MPIRPPALDDRRYEDLVAELLARIPAHTPEWTNPRVGDPGRTLIELFSWLGDALLYRVNLVPERQRLNFLRLLGEPLRPARPARGLVTVSLQERPAIRSYAVRPGARFEATVPFEARDEFTVHPVTARAYYKRPIRRTDVPEVLSALAEFHNQGNPVAGYATTALFTEGKTPAEGFDIIADTADRALWLALFAPEPRPPLTQAAANREVLDALGEGPTGGRAILNVGFVPAMPSIDPLEPVTTRPAVPHVWEITTRTRRTGADEEAAWEPEYTVLDRLSDTTEGLTKEGVLRLALPPGEAVFGPTNDVREDPDAGVGDRPPRLDDQALAARLVAWIRLRPAPPPPAQPAPETQFQTGQGATSLLTSSTGPAPAARQVEHLRVVWAGINAVAVEQMKSQTNVIVGESDGRPDQEFALPARSIEAESLHIQVVEDAGAVTWRRVDDLATLDRAAAASRDARVFQLDREAGTIRFGDGVRGRIPPAGRRIIVRRMRSGGGTAGNLPPDSVKSISARLVTGDGDVGRQLVVGQPLAFTRGADAETLADAEKRIPSRLSHRERAVTPEDYRALAREAPGVAVGRVELLPGFKPQQRHTDVPGVVTVLVLPGRPLGPAPNPRADRPFLEGVHAWLEPRTPLGTELYVIGCEYVPVAISLGVTVAAEAPVDTVLQAVKDAMMRVLWPLAPGGLDGRGWPLGRPLSNRELEVEASRVNGIAEVAGVNLFLRNATSREWEPVGDARRGHEQHVALERWQLPELIGVTAVVGDSAPMAVDAGGITNPFADPEGRPLTVPVVPEFC